MTDPWLIVLVSVPWLLAASWAAADAPAPLKIGVMTDMNGPYADAAGEGSVAAARLAVEDFGPTVLGRPIEIVAADHQNQPDIGTAIARRWFDRDGVEMVTDLTNSAVAIAVQALIRAQQGPYTRCIPAVHYRHPSHRTDYCAGLDIDDGVLLGPHHGIAGLVSAILRRSQCHAHDDPGGYLLRGVTLPARRAGCRIKRGRCCDAGARKRPVDDVVFHDGHVRADGQVVHDMYLARVKAPAESRGPWDVYNIVRTIPGDEAFAPPAASTCPFVHLGE
jgi:Periplasmic binding protein